MLTKQMKNANEIKAASSDEWALPVRGIELGGNVGLITTAPMGEGALE